MGRPANSLALSVDTESVKATPADVYFGRGHILLLEREKIKRQTIELRRLQHRKYAA
jgi:hypothetical protein